MHHTKRPSLKRQARALTWVCYVRGVPWHPASVTVALLTDQAGAQLVLARYEDWYRRWPHLFGVRP